MRRWKYLEKENTQNMKYKLLLVKDNETIRNHNNENGGKEKKRTTQNRSFASVTPASRSQDCEKVWRGDANNFYLPNTYSNNLDSLLIRRDINIAGRSSHLARINALTLSSGALCDGLLCQDANPVYRPRPSQTFPLQRNALFSVSGVQMLQLPSLQTQKTFVWTSAY